MKVGIMQPYIFPYIGYFQLINAVDIFIIYNDVKFIKRGWIHRNNILLNGKPYLFTIPCIQASQNKLINEIKVDNNFKLTKKLLKTITIQYKKAPYFNQVYPIIEKVFSSTKNNITISDMACQSILESCNYLKIDFNFIKSSEEQYASRELKKDKRIISICKDVNASIYINPIGGKELYSKETFNNNEIKLKFLKSLPIEYEQYKNKFIPNLSIIDVMMFNSPKKIKCFLDEYALI